MCAARSLGSDTTECTCRCEIKGVFSLLAGRACAAEDSGFQYSLLSTMTIVQASRRSGFYALQPNLVSSVARSAALLYVPQTSMSFGGMQSQPLHVGQQHAVPRQHEGVADVESTHRAATAERASLMFIFSHGDE